MLTALELATGFDLVLSVASGVPSYKQSIPLTRTLLRTAHRVGNDGVVFYAQMRDQVIDAVEKMRPVPMTRSMETAWESVDIFLDAIKSAPTLSEEISATIHKQCFGF